MPHSAPLSDTNPQIPVSSAQSEFGIAFGSISSNIERRGLMSSILGILALLLADAMICDSDVLF